MAVRKYHRRRDDVIVYCADYYLEDGTRKIEKVATVPVGASARKHERARRKAAQVADERRLEVENGTWEPTEEETRKARKLTFGRLVRRFLQEYQTRSGRIDYYFWSARAWLAFFDVATPADEITAEDVQRFRDTRLERWSPGTVRKNVNALSTMFRWAVARGLLERNPAAPELVRRPPEPKGRTEYLSEEQERLLLENSPPWLRRVILWALNTGMDRGEVVALTWSDVDLAAGTVYAPRSKTGVPRNIPLNETLRAVLRDCQRVRNLTSGGRVFLGPKGEPLTTNQVNLALRRAYRRAGFEVGGPFKIFRHTFASRLAMAGVDMATIARLMGHSTAAITDRYAHLSPRHLQGAMAVLDAQKRGDLEHMEEQETSAKETRPSGSSVISWQPGT